MYARNDGESMAGSAVIQSAMSWRVSASSMASAVSMQIRGMGRAGSVLLGGAGPGEAVGVGAGLDDVAAACAGNLGWTPVAAADAGWPASGEPGDWRHRRVRGALARKGGDCADALQGGWRRGIAQAQVQDGQ
jgi:hypothetical protein